MGQVHAQGSRAEMVNTLKQCDGEYFCNVNQGWQSGDSIDIKQYKRILSDSIFCACPRGNTSVDSFRLYEVLECGSIPIVEQDEYWEKMYPNNPLIQTDASWNKAKQYINHFQAEPEQLENYQKTLNKWWLSIKLKLKKKIAADIGTKEDQSFVEPEPNKKHIEFEKLKNEWPSLVDRDYLEYISKHLNQIQIPKEKFTTYNPGKKIAVVSLYTPEIADYAICSEMSVRDYCLKQGYTFYVYREKLQADANANWSKARAILNHFDDHEDIVWMDSDTIIYNPEKRFEDILEKCSSTKKIIACEDIGANNKKIAKGMMLNSGVVIFRNHGYTKNIIKKWMNVDCDKSSLYASGGDQGILCDILKKSDGFGFNRKIFPMNEFNTEPRFVDENTFILHFMAYPYELKKIFMRYFVSD